MNILMLTNTFTPHIGGVARSVEAFTAEYRKLGHRVLVVAPQFENAPEWEHDVVRVPAIQNFNGSDFSVRLPIPGFLSSVFDEFNADIVHSHHPFLIGDTAQRAAALRNQPLIFTHHTMYEQYTHYVPADSDTLRRFVVELSTGYANLCDRVIAPSESVQAVLLGRGVTAPVEVIATGVAIERFADGDGSAARRRHNIPLDAFVVGHVGRLAPEKNLPFLAESVAAFLRAERQAYFLIVGSGPSEAGIKGVFEREGTLDRLRMAGPLGGQELANTYHAMDAFAFASLSETQGMVLTEAMAAGVPVVALDASGAREVVRDRQNGRLLDNASSQEFAAALGWLAGLAAQDRGMLRQNANDTAALFSMPRCAAKAIHLYETVLHSQRGSRHQEDNAWLAALRVIETEWQLWANFAKAATVAVSETTGDHEAA